MKLKEVKKRYPLIVLAVLLILGFYLRVYHLDAEVIGYHNMKEAHTLMESRHFLEEGEYFSNKYDYKTTLENPEGEHSDNFPLYGWMITLLWKVTGVSVPIARFFTILFALSVIVTTYLVTKELFGRDDIALLSSFFVTICPLFIFFGKTVFYDVPALAFAMASTYFYLIWLKKPKTKFFVLFVSLITLAVLSKMVYLVFLFPMAAVFPYKKNLNKKYLKKNYKQYLWAFILPVTFFLFSNLSNNRFSGGLFERAFREKQLAEFFSSAYWHTIYTYAVVDNFTKIGFLLMVVGFIISCVYIKKESNRFLVVWLLSIIPYSFFIGWMLRGHNYYQMPFVPVVNILIAFTLLFVLNSLVPKFKKSYMKPAIVYGIIAIFFLLVMLPSIKLSTIRQFDTQFIGLDVAGQYMNENSKSNDRVFGSGHQDTGFYWYANRNGVQLPKTLEQIKQFEEELNFRWAFIYADWGMPKYQQNPEIWEHFTSNYEIKQLGLQTVGQQSALKFLLLEKGGNFSDSELNEFISTRLPKTKTYEFSNRDVELVYFDY